MFRLNCERLFLTYPQTAVTKQELLDVLVAKLPVKNAIICQEKHGDGNPHLHAVVKLSKKVNIRDQRLLDVGSVHGKYESCKNYRQAVKYVTKEDQEPLLYQIDEASIKSIIGKKLDPYEFGALKPKDLQPWIIKNGLQLHAKRYLDNHKAFRASAPEPEDCDDVRGYWIYGRPGIGKSTFVRDWARSLNQDLYSKNNDQWFNHYNDERFILFDDVDRYCIPQGNNLKKWADKFKVSHGVKGSEVWLRHEYFVCTSNYRIGEIWSSDDYLCTALIRRFRFIDYERMVNDFLTGTGSRMIQPQDA